MSKIVISKDVWKLILDKIPYKTPKIIIVTSQGDDDDPIQTRYIIPTKNISEIRGPINDELGTYFEIILHNEEEYTVFSHDDPDCFGVLCNWLNIK